MPLVKATFTCCKIIVLDIIKSCTGTEKGVLPFNSSNKYMAVATEMDGGITFFIKGGSDVITDMFVDSGKFDETENTLVTGSLLVEGKPVAFSENKELKEAVTNNIKEMSESGERVLGFIWCG